MAGLVPAIHVLIASIESKTWMAGINPAMTCWERSVLYHALRIRHS